MNKHEFIKIWTEIVNKNKGKYTPHVYIKDNKVLAGNGKWVSFEEFLIPHCRKAVSLIRPAA